MKIEEGKFYKTREGFKAEIYRIHTDNPKYSIHGCVYNPNMSPISSEWERSGKYIFGVEEHDYDLVSEWQEPLDFDWDCLPKWMDRYIAMDRNGKWFSYANKPTILEGGQWLINSESYDFIEIPKNFIPKNFSGDWKDSLFENPKYKEESDQFKKEGWHIFEETTKEVSL